MDTRLIFVFFPVIIAGTWALYNVGPCSSSNN